MGMTGEYRGYEKKVYGEIRVAITGTKVEDRLYWNIDCIGISIVLEDQFYCRIFFLHRVSVHQLSFQIQIKRAEKKERKNRKYKWVCRKRCRSYVKQRQQVRAINCI